PAKLMASMEAARAWGGDGRCSCSPAFPTGCTTLPDTFKSAHIAYMLIGRAGDREGSNGNYRATNFGNAAVPGDFNGDGRPDVAVCGNGGLGVLLNTTTPGRQATLAPLIPTTLGFTGRDLEVADFNADGRLDAAVINNAAGTVAILLGNGDGTFASPVVHPTGAGPQGLAVGDLDGNQTIDLVVANFTGDTCSIFINDGQGVMTLAATLSTGDGSQYPVLADLEGDGDLDLIVTNAAARTVAMFRNNGDATFVAGPVISFAAPPVGIDAGDLNGDGRIDLAITANGDPLVKVFVQNPDGTFTLSTHSVVAAPGNPILRDLDADGKLDLLALQRTASRLYVFKGNGDGTLQPGVWYPIGFAPNAMRAADMDGDGLLDAVVRVSSTIVCIMQGVAGGGFNPVSGLAGGDYFMTFNVANKINADPDPVFILQSMFDAWRADLVGKPDAVRSTATLDPPVLHADEASPAMLTIRARDWKLDEVSLDGASVSVASSSGIVSVGSPTLQGDGTIAFPVTAGSDCGSGTLTVTIEGLGRRVVLMPVSTVIVSDPADFDRSGFVDTDDFDAFVQAFVIGGDDADFDGSGFVDTDDFTEFVLAFQDPC
ncbi:MAG TPA: FG-GAP-like repeat-containing protein, partial [Phycisphaerales bacterium]|nr:FG-GAP-like repeat-containing protein [Phycisphaerales bacterium]